MTRIQALLVSTALLAAGPAAAQYVETWDDNNDNQLTTEEWRSGLQEVGLFNDWDTDESGTIGAEEFAAGLFNQFNGDGEQGLTQAEWDSGFDNWYGEQAASLDWSNWDDDGNGVISEEEFTEAFTENNLFGNFIRYAEADMEGEVAEAEYTAAEIEEYEVDEAAFEEGLFNWFDENDNQYIDADEEGLWSDEQWL